MTKLLKTLNRWFPVICIAVGMILVFISLYFSYANLEALASQNDRVNNTISVLNQAANFAFTAKDLQSNVRGYIITGNEVLLTSNQKLKIQLQAIGDTLHSLVRYAPAQTERLKNVIAISDSILFFSQKLTDTYRLYGLDSASALIKTGKGISLFALMEARINELQEIESSQMGFHKALSSRSRHQTVLFMVGTGITGLLITILAIVFLSKDQTRQRALKREIYRKERMLNQYFEAIPDGVLAINNTREILVMNESAKRMFGIEPESQPASLAELTARVQLFDPADHSLHRAGSLGLSAALNGTEFVGKKIEILKAGNRLTFESNIRPILDFNEEVIGAISVLRDVTDSEAYANFLIAERENAERSAVVKDVFLANMSHEIRTPLNAILGFAYLLESEKLNPTASEYIGYIQVAGRSLLNLINDLLDISKIEVGELQPDMQPTSLSELAASVSILLSQKASEKGIVYQQILSDSLPVQVLTDKLRLTQILLNICGNAVKFTEKGSVTMRIEPAAGVVDGVQRIRFTISDTGIGIAEDKTQKIFDRFVQASESTTREFGGTGLGLSIARSLVQLLNGTLTLESTVGKGTEFFLEFPFEVVDVPVYSEKSETREEIRIEPNSLRILAAEDNLLNQKLLSAVLNRMHLPVTIVTNGQEALEALENDHYDLILMDVQMPVMDGYTAIRNIRTKLNLNTPIITMTAHAMVGEKEECLRIGANSYVSKPFKECELVSEIYRLTRPSETPESPAETLLMSGRFGGVYVDQKYLSEITYGDLVLIDELKQLFQQNYFDCLLQMELFALEQDHPNLEKAIHKFRSSLLSIGLVQTAERYRTIEAGLREGSHIPDASALLAELKKEVIAGITELDILYPSPSVG